MQILVTQPQGKLAAMLAEMGIEILPIQEDEGNVDRYVLSKRLVVERRTGNGFAQGIVDKTLFTSAIYMREHFEVAVLIVEGELQHAHSAFNPQALRGALSAEILQYGVSVLCTPTPEETAHLIAVMARQEQVGIPEISLIPKRKAADLPDMQRRIVEMLPGCGRVMARDLLQRMGSVQRLVEATPDELRAVRGIGAKKAEQIHQVLHAEYASVDTERDLEDALEAAPELLFDHPVTLLARQHTISDRGGERHVVDLVYMDGEACELILVELKRGALAREHEQQLQRYLDRAAESPLLARYLDAGATVRGILATVTACAFEPRDQTRVSAQVVDRERAIQVLRWLRAQRQEDD